MILKRTTVAGGVLIVAVLVLQALVGSTGTAAVATDVETLDELLSMATVGEASRTCVACHSSTVPKLVESWARSRHAAEGVDCLECHGASEEDWDYTEHYAGLAIATHPTAGDCARCHAQQYEEFSRSKHSALSMIFHGASFDRNVLEPTLTTKHGCQQCHNIGHFWPDQSVGECDACHAKHTF
ncbi:MAG TPA: cytochrome c3 family protein, partial [bacterium]|nr:cytochrome c3 family protein [bacterium]